MQEDVKIAHIFMVVFHAVEDKPLSQPWVEYDLWDVCDFLSFLLIERCPHGVDFPSTFFPSCSLSLCAPTP